MQGGGLLTSKSRADQTQKGDDKLKGRHQKNRIQEEMRGKHAVKQNGVADADHAEEERPIRDHQ